MHRRPDGVLNSRFAMVVTIHVLIMPDSSPLTAKG